jgi:sulfotransferase family protein
MPEDSGTGPVFIVGASRSGTTMLSSCINACSPLQIVGETHYFEDLRPRLEGLRSVHSPERFQEIVENYFLALSHRLYGQGGDPEKGSIAREDLRSLASRLGGTPDHVFEAFCRLSAGQKGKREWGEKTPRHIYKIGDILQCYPRAKIVCMIRDGRAVVASYRDFKKGEIGEYSDDPGRKEALLLEQRRVRRSYHVIIASLLWRGVARATQLAHRIHGNEKVYILRYEDLVADAPGELAKLFSWLGHSFDADRLGTVPIATSSYVDKIKSDVGVTDEAVLRWRKKMSDAEVYSVEATTGSQLRYYGYELLKPKVSAWSKIHPWLTLPVASIVAMRANAGRSGGIGGFVVRRLRALR